MPLALKTVAREFRLEDESGYSFCISTGYDPETGWTACASLASHGSREEAGAIDQLAVSARHFLRLYDESKAAEALPAEHAAMANAAKKETR